MKTADFSGLVPSVAEKLRPMIDDMLAEHSENLHSFHVVGSAVIPDYNEKISDINSVVVLHKMDLRFIRFLAPLGNKYGKKKIAAPLVMTPEYIKESLDAFPIEFHDFKLIHRTVFGQDVFADLAIERRHLQLQCEREIKTKQIGLRQGYVSSLGKERNLLPVLVKSFTGSMALFRAIIALLGKVPPIPRAEVIAVFGSASGIDAAVFRELLALKHGAKTPSGHELGNLFERYYQALEAAGKLIDEIPR